MLTAVVLTRNEEKNIKECLLGLKWANEVVVVDDNSTDKTREIAKALGAKVFLRSLDNDFAQQRNFGLNKAKGEWVLFVDADERISPALAKEARAMIARTSKTGFFLSRRDWFGGRLLKHGEQARVRLLRLAKKNSGRWQRAVHETWQVRGELGKLDNPLLHYPHPTISEFISEVSFYSTLHAQALKKENKKATLLKIIFFPLGKFLKNWVIDLGFLDGTAGVIFALMMSLHSFLSWAKLWLSQEKDV